MLIEIILGTIGWLAFASMSHFMWAVMYGKSHDWEDIPGKVLARSVLLSVVFGPVAFIVRGFQAIDKAPEFYR